MRTAPLYTPAMLAAAVELANYPPLPDAPLYGMSRSQTCGSTLAMDLALDGEAIADIGMTVHACAVGQASAAIFVRHAKGRSRTDIARMATALEDWLSRAAPLPEWPDLSLIAPARAFPARHGAIMLPWKAALTALSPATASR
ncbi:MAG: iron-sulfur cluster assembly scaffold protein [Alteraurantiacibacter sp.]